MRVWKHLRQHRAHLLVGALGLAVLTFATDAPPADSAPAASAPVVVTRPVTAIDQASLPRENGLPILPPAQESPTRLTFTTAPEALRLIQDADRILRPGAVQRLVIPKITLDTSVVEVGTERRDGEWVYDIAEQVVGQYAGSNPGEGSNVVLAGHVGTRDGRGGAVFKDLGQLDLGDTIEVYSESGRHDYVVTEVRFVSPSAVDVMEPTPEEQLTLITCRSCNFGCNRLVVIARPAEPHGLAAT